MPHLLDTDVIIHLRDGSDGVARWVQTLHPPFAISILSRVELENGLIQESAGKAERRAALDLLLANLSTLDFGEAELTAYRAIVGVTGFSRRKTVDRMIAATALAHGLELATMNAADYRDIPELMLAVLDER